MNGATRRRLRWFLETWAPRGYTVEPAASGHWKVRDPDGRYVATISGSPANEKSPEYETGRLLERHEEARHD